MCGKMNLEVGTLNEIGAQVGDVVRAWYHQCKKVIAYNGGAARPWRLECQETKIIGDWKGNTNIWRIISRANQAHNGPVRTVTRTTHEIVPGVYGKVHVHACGDFTIDPCAHDELAAAIDTLQTIRDAMRSNAAS